MTAAITVAEEPKMMPTLQQVTIADKFGQLYRAYHNVVDRACLRILRDQADAADAAQETWLRVHRFLDKAPDVQEAHGWIYRIATNCCFNEHHDRERRPIPVKDVPDREGPCPQKTLVDRDFGQRLIDLLPPELWEVVRACYFEEMNQEEAARALDVPRYTVAHRLEAFHRFVEKYVRRVARVRRSTTVTRPVSAASRGARAGSRPATSTPGPGRRTSRSRPSSAALRLLQVDGVARTPVGL